MNINYKLMLVYNIKNQRIEEYYRFILQEFLPRAQRLGLYMIEGWQTVHGDYPARLIVFAAQKDDTLENALKSEVWDSIETKLGEFVTDYERRVVRYKPGFQFFISQRHP